MRFVLAGTVGGFSTYEGQSLELQLGGEGSISVLLYVDGLHDQAVLVCRTEGTWDLDRATESLLMADPVPQAGSLALLADPVLPLDFWPADKRAKLGSIEMELLNASRRVINLLRWRHGIQGEHESLWDTVFGVSRDGKRITLRDSRLSSIGWDEPDNLPTLKLSSEIQGFLRYFVGLDKSEPVGHSLLREALEHVGDNPRSALVIGVAAAEVAVRQFFAEFASPLVPALLGERQGPPIHQLLSKYFPMLVADQADFAAKKLPRKLPEEWIIKPIERANENRNTVVHAPATDRRRHGKLEKWMDDGGLATALQAISDLLWLLDYYRGYHWALDNVRSEAIEAWKTSDQ
jgi:hypothetical protein